MIEFHGLVRSDGILTFPPNEERRRMLSLKKYIGKSMTERLYVSGRARTYAQIKAHYGLLIQTIITQANDEGIDTSAFLKLMVRDDLPTGVGLTKDFLHELLLMLCPVRDEDGRRKTLRNMTTEEASRWFEQCRNLLASRGIYVDDPDPNWRTKRKETP